MQNLLREHYEKILLLNDTIYRGGLHYVVVQSRVGSYGNDRTIEDGEAVMKSVVWETN